MAQWTSNAVCVAGAARLQSLRYVAVCGCLAVIHTLMAVRVSYAQKHFSTALSEKNRGELFHLVHQQPIFSIQQQNKPEQAAVFCNALQSADGSSTLLATGQAGSRLVQLYHTVAGMC
jgi:hypothetical protein